MEEHIRQSLSNHPNAFQHFHSSSPHPSHRSSDRMTPRSFNEGTSTAVETEESNMSHQQQRHTSTDEEGMPPPRYTPESDPFHLASKLKTEEEISQIKANTSRKRDSTSPKMIHMMRKPGAGAKQALTTRKLRGFYENQNENIERMLKPVEEHVRAARELNTENSLKYKIAVYASFAANIILCVVQVYGAASSGSLSLFTTMADAIFDPMSNLTLLLCNKAVNRVDSRKFPAGKARIETAGNICFCFLMTAVSFIIIAFSIREIVEGSDTLLAPFHLPSIIAVSVAFFTKLGLFLYCFALRNQVSQIRILWEDHRNDLIINGMGVMTSILGSKVRWWIDPMGAIILSVLVSGLWLHSAYGEFQLLVGVTADTKMQQLITYISMTHSPLITAIDTVRAYTSGPRLLVEVDIVMEDSASLRATHDVAEELQMKLESLPDVERAYVHVDYETTHKPEHFLKKEL
ncbi:hypothetical protein N7462_005825 [Penicillium macrosclerotiorum]|uniref:uncharacterized protein n=1 Tax=Penicillium macrosclerotiorum TaxID=303699 RepID=UPI002548498B|nr:uncharacterized protein N7462_005825 [Penicillium macrosclerotiorum]KAJ5682660.1 hypothetical protein N7462_005825 [Penicillium macrosclerotiorum]